LIRRRIDPFQGALPSAVYLKPGDIRSAVVASRIEILSLISNPLLLDDGHQQDLFVDSGLNNPLSVGPCQT